MAEILLSGLICDNDVARMYRWYGFDAACPRDFRAQLEKAGGEDVTIYVNSNGGDMTVGAEIAAIIEGYSGMTIADTQGKAASAATLAITGAKKRRCEAGAIFCVHNPWTYTEGDHRTHTHTAESLLNAKNACINLYEKVMRTKSREEIAALMDKDIWINAEQALEFGLVDEVSTGKEATRFAASAGAPPILTTQMRDVYMKHIAAEQAAETAKNAEVEAARKRLFLLRTPH